MSDSEKFDLILSEIQGMKNEMQDMKSEMQDMKSEMQDMKSEMQDIKNEMQGIKSEMQGMKEKVEKVALGQLEIKKEMYMLNRRITDTYNVALDALGTSAENRTWLEKGILA